MYAFKPLSLGALIRLVEYEANGRSARFERYAAEMLYMLAAGNHIDTDRTKRFGDQLASLYADPFKKAKKPMSAAEIKEYIRGKIRKLRKKRD